MRKFMSALLGGFMAVGAVLGGSVARADDYYAGKTITVIVGLAPGGSADTLVRMFTPYLRKHIPGDPNIIVQNMPGAGGVLSFNYMYEKAKPDGQTMIFTLWDPLAQAFGNQGLRARYDQYDFLGGTGDIRVNYMRVDSVPGGAKKPADIMKAKDVVIGAYATTDLSGILAHLSLKTLGVPHKVVTGYRGGADVFLALQRGEVNVHDTSLATFRTRSKSFISTGEGIGLCYLVPSDAKGDYQRSAQVTDMPAFQDLYKEVHGKLPSGPLWDAFNWTVQQFSDLAHVAMAPPGTPGPVLAVLRKGFEDAMNDPEFIKESTTRNGLPFDYVNVEHGKRVFRALSEVSPETLATLRASLETMGSSK
jgi:hypothetical protein